MPSPDVSTFTVRPNPECSPSCELDAIGSSSPVVHGDRTAGEVVDAIDDKFDFQLDSGLSTYKPYRDLRPETKGEHTCAGPERCQGGNRLRLTEGRTFLAT